MSDHQFSSFGLCDKDTQPMFWMENYKRSESPVQVGGCLIIDSLGRRKRKETKNTRL